MRAATSDSSRKSADAPSSRTERDIIGVLLALVGAAALWWAGGWWWRASHAEAVPAPRPPTTEAALPLPLPRSDRRRALALGASPSHPDAGVVQREAPPGAIDGGAGAAPSEQPAPGRVAHGVDRGHGSESWARSGAPGREDFEPRYSLDAGTFVEPAVVAAEAPRAFH